LVVGWIYGGFTADGRGKVSSPCGGLKPMVIVTGDPLYCGFAIAPMDSLGKSSCRMSYTVFTKGASITGPRIATPTLNVPFKLRLLARSTSIPARLIESSTSTANIVDSKSCIDQSNLIRRPKNWRANGLSVLPMDSRCMTVRVRGAIRASRVS